MLRLHRGQKRRPQACSMKTRLLLRKYMENKLCVVYLFLLIICTHSHQLWCVVTGKKVSVFI